MLARCVGLQRVPEMSRRDDGRAGIIEHGRGWPRAVAEYQHRRGLLASQRSLGVPAAGACERDRCVGCGC